jgi:hypothetical protein
MRKKSSHMENQKLVSLITNLNKNISERFLNKTKPGRSHYGVIWDEESEENQPIALVVGINYGQCETAGAPAHQAVIGYSRKITRLAKLQKLNVENYTVVLWNFYPYLTESEWTEEVTNSKEEAEKIFDDGYNNPFAVFEKVYSELNPQIIVFHGITSAVPILARVGLCKLKAKQKVFLVPNLSRGLCERRITTIQ